MDTKIEEWRSIFRQDCINYLTEYVADAADEMWKTKTARMGLEAEVSRWRRDRSDLDIKLWEMFDEMKLHEETLNNLLSEIT